MDVAWNDVDHLDTANLLTPQSHLLCCASLLKPFMCEHRLCANSRAV